MQRLDIIHVANPSATISSAKDAAINFKAGKLSAQDMIDAILARVAEIDKLMTEQKALRQKLMDHIGWFKTQARRKP